MTVFSHTDCDGHEAVHFIHDAATGLRAIIAVHSTRLGPAAGGCRMWEYASEADAVKDALRLSRGMSYKNAVAGLPYGGGKAVIIGDARRDKSPDLFAAFGRAVEQLGGQYVTAEDVGITVDDMKIVSGQTSYVSGLPQTDGADAAGGDPSPKTARGVFHGIRAAVAHRLGKTDLAGLTVAVQGLGGVGYNLCRDLHAAGATLVVADIHEDRVARAVAELGAAVADPAGIPAHRADVFAPCALGGVINPDSIATLAAPIVAGGANNQLATEDMGRALKDRGVLYAPDYVINAGGIINVIAEYDATASEAEVDRKVAAIGDRLAEIFARADREDRPTNEIANDLAREIMDRGPADSASARTTPMRAAG